MFQTINVAKGVNVHVNQTTQFKTINFSIRFKDKLTKEKASARSVLANVLQHSNEVYPSHTALRMVLDDLYGTSLYMDSTKRGNEHIVTLNVETVNDEYLSESGVLEKVMNLMYIVLFKPNFEAGLFKQSIFEREKSAIKERIESVFDEKTRYAQQRMLEHALPDHPASISPNGTIDDVESVTNELLVAEYRTMIEENEIEIYAVGDIQPETVASYIREFFHFGDREKPIAAPPLELKKPEEPHVREFEVMKQGKLHLAFYTPVTFKDEKFPIMQLMNGVLGGYAHSKLFVNIREKESMAYYVSSSYASQFGLLFVLAGIDANLEEKAVKLILEQLEEVKKGNITDTELDQTKALLTNQLKEALDSARGQIEIYDQYMELSDSFEPEDLIKRWKNVTKEDIAAVAQDISLEMTYFLSGKEEDSDE
ncbi:EF-P 5-aminopentanol modification-associated protein YfmF [Planomicrobium sp. CPCC 101110]|uniref:EF-P 5-aminopentanol modification-associated protein YfmF n=1 Tax=Planomicrobium sp. CPCC 101110 TaxID=2599619 RepID=UPI0011B55650|nr:pitrilysin family protein [Planomicrobium sp. CPCC 101110]TWT28211.1 insulinase family protein [Planomicrobium sp. CPCC 101110]